MYTLGTSVSNVHHTSSSLSCVYTIYLYIFVSFTHHQTYCHHQQTSKYFIIQISKARNTHTLTQWFVVLTGLTGPTFQFFSLLEIQLQMMSSFFNTLLPELLKGQIWSLGGRMCHDGNFGITSTWNSHENISFNGCDLRVFKCSFQSILTTTGMCPALLSSRKMPLHRHGLSESIKPNLNENDCCIPRHEHPNCNMLLMNNILQHLEWQKSPVLTQLLHPHWCRILSINSMLCMPVH